MADCADAWAEVESYGDTFPLPDPDEQAAYNMASAAYNACVDECLAPYTSADVEPLPTGEGSCETADGVEGLACALWAAEREASDVLDGLMVSGCDELL